MYVLKIQLFHTANKVQVTLKFNVLFTFIVYYLPTNG